MLHQACSFFLSFLVYRNLWPQIVRNIWPLTVDYLSEAGTQLQQVLFIGAHSFLAWAVGYLVLHAERFLAEVLSLRLLMFQLPVQAFYLSFQMICLTNKDCSYVFTGFKRSSKLGCMGLNPLAKHWLWGIVSIMVSKIVQELAKIYTNRTKKITPPGIEIK